MEPQLNESKPPVPPTMRAATRRVYGGPEVVGVEHLPRQEPRAGEVLIRVAAAGLDRATLHLLTGLPKVARLALGARRPKRVVLGQQVAGEVVAVGEAVGGYAVGDRVFGTAGGSFAEYAVAPVATLAATPAGVENCDAATLGVSGLTAWDAVVDHGRVQSGQRVLVLGGSGAVGSCAVQLAVHRGARVTAACSAPKRDFVIGLGAHRALDYRAVDLADMGGPFDCIIDIGGNRAISLLRSALTPAGRLVIVGGETGGAILGGLERNLAASLANPFTRQHLAWFVSRTTSQGCAELAVLVAEGALRPAIDRTVGLDGVPDVLMTMERGELRGQAVICP